MTKTEEKTMKRLVDMGREYLSDTYGAEKESFKIDFIDIDEESYIVDFIDDYSDDRYEFEYNRRTGFVTFALFRSMNFEGEVEIGRLKRA